MGVTTAQNVASTARPAVKCVVWDLDNTLWDGVLLEDEAVRPRPEALRVIAELEQRGILNSIASKNDYATAMAKLRQLGLADYFLYPQIGWSAKSAAMHTIAGAINIGVDTLAFVDDQPFELEEVASSVPEVRCINSAELDGLLDLPEMNPRFITDESKLRRSMYQADIARNEAEEAYVGPKESFLASLGMEFTLAPASEEDLKRAEELTIRTHQLNTTGYTYSYEELDAFRSSPDHLLLVASLTDKYGSYGKIGLALVECGTSIWRVKLLLMSCRVMSRGVGTIMMNEIMARARAAGARLQAEFITTDRNRMMYITYKFGGFSEVERQGNHLLFECDLSQLQPPPAYVRLNLLA